MGSRGSRHPPPPPRPASDRARALPPTIAVTPADSGMGTVVLYHPSHEVFPELRLDAPWGGVGRQRVALSDSLEKQYDPSRLCPPRAQDVGCGTLCWMSPVRGLKPYFFPPAAPRRVPCPPIIPNPRRRPPRRPPTEEATPVSPKQCALGLRIDTDGAADVQALDLCGSPARGLRKRCRSPFLRPPPTVPA
eukprot:TRINITY_DN8354_c0_g1_i1.p2 TRINITY_DN8354_c0_g1~~TRINITY_DN8354_c0_g1_i1.p2  ORF type:complete len:191 (+),score=36.26 TRINITY_DN8354_c0_g1_i1:59-631(+)